MKTLVAILKLILLVLMLPIFSIGMFIGFVKISFIGGIAFIEHTFEDML